jgi:YegS/Rv2252/BmrU family lipid kinase
MEEQANLMETPMTAALPQRFFVVFNPVAGTGDAAEMRHIFEQHFAQDGRSYELYETNEHDAVDEVVRRASQRDFDMIVAAGGDGTLSSVANGLLQCDIPMGIVPVGTSNVLARELHLPINADAACRLLTTEHSITSLDALRMGDVFSILHMGIGFDAEMIRRTKREHKRRFGRLAYVWSGIKRLAGFQPRRFSLVVDGETVATKAGMVLLANGGTIGLPFLRWGQDISPHDGRIDVCIVKARSFWDYLLLGWSMLTRQQKHSRRMRFLAAHHKIALSADVRLPVHADGDVVGETPIDVQVLPQAVRVVVPGESVEALKR